VTELDPAELDRWDEADRLCPNTIEVSIMGATPQQLPCENDAGHEPPCAVTLNWTQIQA